MTARFATPDEIARWNELVLSNPDGGNVFQSREMAQQKKYGGWKARFVIVNGIAVTVLERSIFGLGKIWYMPKGPGIIDTKTLFLLADDIYAFARKKGVFVLKV